MSAVVELGSGASTRVRWPWALMLALSLHALLWWILQTGHRVDVAHARAVEVRMTPLIAKAAPKETAAQGAALESPAPEPGTRVDARSLHPRADLTPNTSSSPMPVSVGPLPLTAPLPASAPGPGEPGWVFEPESYLDAEQVDVPPRLVGNWVVNDAAIPAPSGDRPNQLRVVVRMWVSASGHIDIVQFLDAAPVVPWLEDLFKDIALTTLSPAVKDGAPVATSWMVELNLDLLNGF